MMTFYNDDKRYIDTRKLSTLFSFSNFVTLEFQISKLPRKFLSLASL